ncbi:MAG: alpha-galactosidase [Armatimonadetes bacterium]|nr:alpha-galactosidase [Armatimonadota bacterium]
MPTITMIGAGSITFTRRLYNDILAQPELRESTIRMVDIDEEKLAAITGYAQEVAQRLGYPTRVEGTTDRRRGLEGADVVICSIAVGTEQDRRADVFIPQAYGVEQLIGDTLGPGGVFRALRTGPVMVDIGRDIEAVCPDAWWLNYTNPMAICTWAVLKGTRARIVGLCHSVQGTTRQLAGYMGVPYGEVDYWVAGINHMAWYLRLERKGQDLYPRLREALDDPETFAKDPVRFEVFRHFGYFVTESTRHMGEYVPYFYKDAEHIRQLGMEPRQPREGWDHERWQQHAERLTQELSAESLPEPTASEEYASWIIRSLVTGERRRINGNVLNEGLIDNLPGGCCVEVPCLVEQGRIAPCHVGPLPPQLAALNASNVALQECCVDAILERDLRKAYHAVALDPLTAGRLTLPQIKAMFEEMVEAERESLREYTEPH